jgi:hypothetical protein
MVDGVLIILQNLTDSGKERVLCSEISPASSQDEYQAISVKTEVLSDAESEEDHLAIKFPGLIKAEPEVSCVTMSMLGRFH